MIVILAGVKMVWKTLVSVMLDCDSQFLILHLKTQADVLFIFFFSFLKLQIMCLVRFVCSRQFQEGAIACAELSNEVV